jgi:hypothetical protein
MTMAGTPPDLVVPPLEATDELRLRWSHDSLFGRASASLEALLRAVPGRPLMLPGQLPEEPLRLAAPPGPNWYHLDVPVAGGVVIAHALPAPVMLVASRLEHPDGTGLLLELEPEPARGDRDAEATILLLLPIADPAVWSSAFSVLLTGTEAPGLRLWVEFHRDWERLQLHAGGAQSLDLSGELPGQPLRGYRWCFPPPGPALAALQEGGSAHVVLGLPAARAWRFGLLDAGLVVHPA